MIARLLLYGLAIYVFWKLIRSILGPKKSGSKPQAPIGVDDVLETDPVSGVRVPRSEALTAVIKGTTYYFCSEANRRAFMRERAAP